MEATNPFAKFKTNTKTVEIKNFGSVTLRQQTIAEAHEYNASIYKDFGFSDKPKVDVIAVAKANLQKVANSLLEPKVTLEDLQGLGRSADPIIADILTEIDDWDGKERAIKKQAEQLATQNGTTYEDELEKLQAQSGN